MSWWVSTLDIRVAHYDRTADPAQPQHHHPCIYVCWHEYIWTTVPGWAHCPLTLLVSEHRDAAWLSEAAERLGLRTVRGSSTRGGSRAIRQLKAHGRILGIAITPDGPVGPRRHVGVGPIYLASLLRMPIVPIGIGNDHPWRLPTWDHFAIPRPGSRARLVFGPRIVVPPRLERDELEQWRRRVQDVLEQLTSHAEAWAASSRGHVDEVIHKPRTRPIQRQAATWDPTNPIGSSSTRRSRKAA